MPTIGDARRLLAEVQQTIGSLEHELEEINDRYRAIFADLEEPEGYEDLEEVLVLCASLRGQIEHIARSSHARRKRWVRSTPFPSPPSYASSSRRPKCKFSATGRHFAKNSARIRC